MSDCGKSRKILEFSIQAHNVSDRNSEVNKRPKKYKLDFSGTKVETDVHNSGLTRSEPRGGKKTPNKPKPCDLSFYFINLFKVKRAVNGKTIDFGRQHQSIGVIPG